MFTRQDYLSGKCSHAEYYGQFVTESIKEGIVKRFGKYIILRSYQRDVNFNTELTPLHNWGYYSNNNKFKEFGDFYSLAGAVCIEKEAARQIAESLIKS